MANFEMKRFLQVAKWDLTINKAFYRNFALVTLAITVCTTIMGFFFRWLGVKNSNWADYEVTGTVFMIVTFFSFMHIISAGCINHSLRNKQGRIMELTMPATNLEKFLWHALLMTVGTYIVCLLSLIISDGVNAVLTMLIFPSEAMRSLTDTYFNDNIFWRFGDSDVIAAMTLTPMTEMTVDAVNDMYNSIFILQLGASLLGISVYAFGNALKYKYNIILTCIALGLLQFLGTIIIVLMVINFNIESLFMMIENKWTVLASMGIIMIVIAAILWFASYKLYTRAQITSKWNR